MYNNEEPCNKADVSFSVLMSVYKNDNPEHFKLALESIINQTIKPEEIVLVVDGPVPDTIEEVIKLYEGNSCLKVLRLPENVGHGNARKIGLEKCSNELVALMDADDICVTDRFEKQIKCFQEDSSLSVVGGNIKEFINSVENIVGIREVPQNDTDIKKYLKRRCPFNHVTVMFRKTKVEEAGGYIDWYCDEDYYLWIRMYQNNAKFMNLKDVLVYVRVGNDMYKRRGGWKYFRSEAKLQKYMFDQGIIGLLRFISNILVRFVVQILLPNILRGFIYKKFARKNYKKKL